MNGLNSSYYGISSGSFFSNAFGNNTNSGNNSDLVLYKGFSEVNSIAYRRLLKEYFATSSSSDEKNSTKNNLLNTLDTTNNSALNTKELKSNADAVKDAAAVLTKVDEDKNNVLFSKDRDEIDKAVRSFIDKYNTLVKGISENKNDNVRMGSLNGQLTSLSQASQYSLSKVGITANSDGTLSIDEKKYNNATVETLKDVFTGKSSFTERVSTKAEYVSDNVERYATKSYDNYTQNLKYINSFNTGNLYNSFF